MWAFACWHQILQTWTGPVGMLCRWSMAGNSWVLALSASTSKSPGSPKESTTEQQGLVQITCAPCLCSKCTCSTLRVNLKWFASGQGIWHMDLWRETSWRGRIREACQKCLDRMFWHPTISITTIMLYLLDTLYTQNFDIQHDTVTHLSMQITLQEIAALVTTTRLCQSPIYTRDYLLSLHFQYSGCAT